MTSKRKAELQRKLSLASVPRPPEDLADRIKADIPKYLNVEAERARFSRSIGFNLRIAASILVLVSIASLLFVFAPAAPRKMPMAMRSAPKDVAAAESKEQNFKVGTVTVEMVGDAAPEPAAVTTASSVAPVMQIAEAPRQELEPQPRRERAEAFADTRTNNEVRPDAVGERDAEGAVAGTVYGGVAGGMIGVAAPPPPAVDEALPVPAPAAPARVPAAPARVPAAPARVPAAPGRASAAPAMAMGAPAIAPPAEPAARTNATSAKVSDSLVPEAYAAALPLAPKSVFGISVDPEVFRRIKSTVEHGGRPSASAINVEALVNYFAGAPARRVRRGVRLEVEGSPAATGVNGHRGILRFSVDTASVEVPERGSNPPIATDARLEIELNGDAVASFTPVGGDAPVTESALLHNVSVTGLYAIDLKTPVNQRQRIATVRLHYRTIADGKHHTIVRVLHGSDFAKQWTAASRRHRLASLGAVWGESLRGMGSGPDVAKRAEELASQAPGDVRARELAEVAIASSGGGK